jgi:hypothetical protein
MIEKNTLLFLLCTAIKLEVKIQNISLVNTMSKLYEIVAHYMDGIS